MKSFVSCILIAIVLNGCVSQSTGSPAPADSLTAQTIVSPALSQKEYNHYHRVVESYFSRKLLTKGFNGSILVAKNGEIVFESYHGRTDPRGDEMLTAETAMHIASTSKTFTGMAVLQLVEKGLLHLDDTLTRFFPDFPYAGVTVKTLLSHRSGLPNYLYCMDADWDKSRTVTNQEVLKYLIEHKPGINYQPDRHFNYCNTNYVLLALILEQVTGTPFPRYMKEHFFEPLKMDHTFIYVASDSTPVISSYRPNGRTWLNDCYEGTYGDKNVYSTPRDLLKWDQALYDGRILSDSMLQLAYTPLSNERPSIHNYGLGWRLLMLKNGKKVIYHNGRWHGFNAAFARLTDEKATIIILGNKYNSRIYTSARKAYDLFGNYLQDKNDKDDDDNDDLVKASPSHSSGQHVSVIRTASDARKTISPNSRK